MKIIEYKELLIGLVLAGLGGVGIWYFRVEVLAVLLGVIPPIVLLVGVMFLVIGVSTMRGKGAERERWKREAESEREEK